MAPFLKTIPARDLALHAKLNTIEKSCVGYNGQLEKGEELEMLQYICEVQGEKVVCRPVERFFRRFGILTLKTDVSIKM
ncbi:hypothetical protein GcM1_240080 [Golovinomyces cichoracearum]|uniref:Uncharacterized protein n=1 Tax=Golovinomyces cichoracearum TaxID=62708 RepID=A0A420IIE8_9PEZI|nr:hypothetical protein GcM1_240080 [Golovinomyces cichoracearum]